MKDKKTWKDRFQYKFDSQMAKGSMELIKLLTVVTLVIVIVISLIIVAFDISEYELNRMVFWETFSTVINAWMPDAEDGTIAYVLLMALAAISGLFITSVLIGIFTTSIEEKINSLKKGNSPVVEENHTVVLGFTPGEYTLLQQLILAADDEPTVIVVGGEMERDEMEEILRDNLEIPKNIKIICRSIDLSDPSSLEKCSIPDCKTVVINYGDDTKTIKTVLAVTKIIDPEECPDIRINAIVERKQYLPPRSFREEHNINMLHAGNIISKVISRACTQPGIAAAFEEVFNFNGYDLYSISIPEAANMTFAELTARMDQAVPVGYLKDEWWYIAPKPDEMIPENAKLLVFASDEDIYTINQSPATDLSACTTKQCIAQRTSSSVGIINANENIITAIEGLPARIQKVYLAGISEDEFNEIASKLENTKEKLVHFKEDIQDTNNLEAFTKLAEHIVIMSPEIEEDEDADMDTIFKILKLRDIRSRLGSSYNITAEMCKETNQQLIKENDMTDFVVSSNMASLFLAQLTENSELYGVFREILSSHRTELLIYTADELHLTGTHKVADLRLTALHEGVVILGYQTHEYDAFRFDLPLNETMNIPETGRFVVFGEV